MMTNPFFMFTCMCSWYYFRHFYLSIMTNIVLTVMVNYCHYQRQKLLYVNT